MDLSRLIFLLSVLRNRNYCNRWYRIHSTNRIYYAVVTPGLICTIDSAPSLTLVEGFDTSRTNKIQEIGGTATREAGLTRVSAAGPAFGSRRRECGDSEETREDVVLFHGQYVINGRFVQDV